MKNLRLNIFIQLSILLTQFLSYASEVPFPGNPDFISSEIYFYSTGGAFADIDENGFLDLVFSNGNDMASQQETVYYNFTGIPLRDYGWISDDSDFSGHLAMGDLDKDGDLDLVVANFMRQELGTNFLKTTSKIYYNMGGYFETSPSWESLFSNNSFSTALGDFDGDGDLDVAFANGQIYGGEPQKNTIYRNNDGIIEQLPCWYSDEEVHTMDLTFGDFNNDGLLDIAYANSDAPITIHYNSSSGLEKSPSWISDDTDSSNSITTGDFNSDGFQDIAVTTNTDYTSSKSSGILLKGSGICKIYYNKGDEIEKSPSWISYERGMSSSLAAGDVDGDGDTDLAVGGWWEASRIYINEDGNLHQSKDWQCDDPYNSVAEAMQFGDVDNDGLTAIFDEKKTSNGFAKVFYLNKAPIREIIDIIIDGIRVDNSDYFVNPELGYITLSKPPAPGVNNISISYLYSMDLDLLVSNWDPDKGNYIFFNSSQDKAPPYVKNHNPPRHARNVPTSEVISFTITDSNSGINPDTISIESNLDGAFEQIEVEDGYLIQYKDNLPSNFEININVIVSDNSFPPNIIPLHNYSFRTSAESPQNPPTILCAGYSNSIITEKDGGILKIFAMVQDPEEDVLEVQVYYSGVYTGVSLHDNGLDGDETAFDGIFSRFISIPPDVPKNQYLFTLVAVDSNGLNSTTWPYLTVKENERYQY